MKLAKNICLGLGAAAALCAHVSAAAITIVNHSFEADTGGKVKTGFDAPGLADVPGWSNIGAGASNADTGVQDTSPDGMDGLRSAFLLGSEPGAYNLTNYVISTGDVFSLSWLAGNAYGSHTQKVTLFKSNDAGATRLALVTFDGVLSNAFAGNFIAGQPFLPYAMPDYTATAADEGFLIGIQIENGGSSNSSYTGFDKFSLNVVPESGSVVLAGMAGLLGMLRRRR